MLITLDLNDEELKAHVTITSQEKLDERPKPA